MSGCSLDAASATANTGNRPVIACFVTERPQAVAFDSWGTTAGGPGLPQSAPTWTNFWEAHDARDVTSEPVGVDQ